jgi:hypothetical protein
LVIVGQLDVPRRTISPHEAEPPLVVDADTVLTLTVAAQGQSVSAELANMPGHPAIRIGAAHKKKFEDWLRATFEAAGITEARQLARQILLLLDGSFAVVLLHRDPSYMETAGQAAHALTKAALAARKKASAR